MTQEKPSRVPSDLTNAFEDRPRAPSTRPKFAPKDTTKLTYDQNLRAVKSAQGVLASVYATSSLDATLPGSEEEDFSIGSLVADPRVNVEAEVERKLQVQELRTAVSLLPIKSRKAVALHFLEGKTFEEIGEELGLSRGRIGQIMEISLGLLKKYMNGEISADEMRRSAPSKTPEEVRTLHEEEHQRRFTPRGARLRERETWEQDSRKDDPDTQPGPNGELSPLLQRLVDDMSRVLMRGRADFKREFPNAFFPDETMTDAERQVFMGRRSLIDPDDFPNLCEMWGMTLEEGEVLFKKSEKKYYEFALE